jgi:hypothetical protein
MKTLIVLLFLSMYARAGLPPTSSKAAGESVYTTTFKTNYGTIPMTRVGGEMTFGTIPVSAGGTGNATSYTSGSLLFSDGTKIVQDNANLFYNSASFFLGIGKNVPAYALDVNGSINADGDLRTDGSVRISSAGGGDVRTPGGVLFMTSGAKPVCNSFSRGKMWVTHSATLVEDLVEVCKKTVTDTYSWMTIPSAIDIKESFNANGVLVSFSLSVEPLPTSIVDVYVDGLLQDYTQDYTILGSTITFVSAPGIGQKIVARYKNIK